MAALQGDINENDDGDIIQVYAYPAAGSWHLKTDFRSHRRHETWSITVLCARDDIVQRGAPIGNGKPLFLRDYSNLGDNVDLDTGYRTDDYVCGIVGFQALDGDINENDDGTILRMFMYRKWGRWRLRADFRTHNDHENWGRVSVLCASTSVAQVGHPSASSTRQIVLKEIPGLPSNGWSNTGISDALYACGIVGMEAYDGDIQEDDSGDILQTYAYRAGGTWRLRTDFRTHKDHENWNIKLLCIRRPAAVIAEPQTASEYCVDNVEGAWANIPVDIPSTRRLGARNEGQSPFPRYTTDITNAYGINEHFQGIARLRGDQGDHLVVSGGVFNTYPQRSELLIYAMGSRSPDSAWSLPSYPYGPSTPSSADRLLAVHRIDTSFWHAGGIQAHGNLVAVPIFGNFPSAQGSEVRFFDLSIPSAPLELPNPIFRPPGLKSNAVGLARLPDWRFISVVWNDQYLDFYTSHTASPFHGFDHAYSRFDVLDTVGGFQNEGNGLPLGTAYQSINLVMQCDGAMYLMGARNRLASAPYFSEGEDVATLYRVQWPVGTDGHPDYGGIPTLYNRGYKIFACRDFQCSFAAGAGLFSADSNHLSLYTTSHWFDFGNSVFRFNEFSYP